MILIACNSTNLPKDFLADIDRIESKLRILVDQYAEVSTDGLIAPKTMKNGKLVMVPASDWTSGFFAGELWMMYDLTSDQYWKEKALRSTLLLENEKWNGNTLNMGVKMYCSFGKALKYTGDPKYRDILIQSARTLAIRFKPSVGCIRSWNYDSDKWEFPTTVDNIMNLELLFWAAKETGNALFKEIAVKHAEKTMENHFAEDFSTYHLVDYNPNTGQVQNKITLQRYSDESCSCLDQAWGLSGFTMVYRETGDEKFLKHAENIAFYLLNNSDILEDITSCCASDGSDISDKQDDVLAATIIASALYELSTFSQHDEMYLDAADKLFESLTSDQFFDSVQDSHGFLLKHPTGSRPHQLETDIPLVYSDYYFIEMILRKSNLFSPNL